MWFLDIKGAQAAAEENNRGDSVWYDFAAG